MRIPTPKTTLAALALGLFALAGCDEARQELPTGPKEEGTPAPQVLFDMRENPRPESWGPIPSLDLGTLLSPRVFSSGGPALTTEATSSGGLQPDHFEATLAAGASATESKVLTITGAPPAADVVFSLDLTGSMGGVLSNAKANAVSMMNTLAEDIPDIRFGYLSYEDYPANYGPAADNCGYEAPYGGSGDRPYRLDIALTPNVANVAEAINASVLGWGADGPEAYTRAFYEAYAELEGNVNPEFGPIGWRSGARRFLVNFGDNVPHDCNLNAVFGPTASTWSTGKDPGRDGQINTPDDLELLEVLDGLKRNNVTLVNLLVGTGFKDLWDAWAERADGLNYIFGSADPIAETIAALISQASQTIRQVNLQVCTEDAAEFGSWLTSASPASYTEVDVSKMDADLPFELEFTVPEGTEDGVYEFNVCGIGDGAEYGRQTVAITVESAADPPPPADDCEGCSAGFWSQNGVRTGAYPSGYAPGHLVSSLFEDAAGYLGDATLLQALEGYRDSRTRQNTDEGAMEILLRQAVAAVLNEAKFGDAYPAASVAAIQMAVGEALTSGDRAAILALADKYDRWNNNLKLDPVTGEWTQVGTCPL